MSDIAKAAPHAEWNRPELVGDSPSEYDIIVLGAGVAGLAALDNFSGGSESVLCLESFDRLGGSHKSVDLNGYTFDIGSFVFHKNFPFLRNYPELFDLLTPFKPGQQRITPDGLVRAYPYERSEVFGAHPLSALSNLFSLVGGRLGVGEVRNADEYARRLIGRKLYEKLGLRNYMERFCGTPASSIDRSFVDHRMQFVRRAVRPQALVRTLGDVLLSKVRKPQPPVGKVAYARPREGFLALYGGVADKLEAGGVNFAFGIGLKSITREGERFRIKTDRGVYSCARLISTIPLHVLWRLLPSDEAFELNSSRLISLFLSFSGEMGFSKPILFNFHNEGRWKRLTMHSFFYGEVNDRSYFSVEIPEHGDRESTVDDLFSDFRQHTSDMKLFSGDLRLEGHCVTEYAYPHYEVGYAERLSKAFNFLEKMGIETVGRQGRFDYLPTSHQVFMQVNRQLSSDRSGAG